MSDALERLKHRNRPVVPSRDASLSSASPNSESLDTLMSRHLEVKNSGTSGMNQGDAKDGADPGTELQTKQSTLRLEQGISDRLQSLCRTQGLCREVLIEALFEQAERSPEALQVVLAQAREKQEQRQQVANQRRAKSMMERFGQSAGPE